MTRRRRPARRWLAGAALLAALASSGLAPGPASAAAPIDRSATALAKVIDPMLRARADAFRRHDVVAFMRSVDGTQRAFAVRQRAFVQNAARITFSSYSLSVDADWSGDLSRPRDGKDTVVVPVQERLTVKGFDATPAVEELYFAVRRELGGAWRITSDTPVDDVGLLSARHPWDVAPISVATSRHFLVMAPPNQAGEMSRVLSESEASLARDLPQWHQPWDPHLVVELPASLADLGRRIQATYPIDDFVAFTYSTVDRSADGRREPFTGTRVMIQPDAFLGRSTADRREVLAHELIHAASRPVSGPLVPNWLEEGIAQVLGEGRSPIPLSYASGSSFDGRLPDDVEFSVGGTARIYRSYAEGYLAVREIERLVGEPGLERFYVALGGRGLLRAGTQTYQVDRAMRQVLGLSLTRFVSVWAADIRASRLR